MKKSLFKRCVCGAVAIAAALSFTACGKSEIPMASKENVYSSTSIKLPQSFDYISSMGAGNDQIYVVGTKSTESGEGDNLTYTNKTLMSILDSQGNEINSVVLAEDDGSGGSKSVNKMYVDGSGYIYMLVSEYKWNEETSESTSKFFVDKYDADGKLVSEIDVTSIGGDSSEYSYIDTMTVGNDGYLYFSGNNNIYVTDGDGKLVYSIKGEESGNNSGSYINSLCKTGDGRIVAVFNSYTMDGDTYTSKNTAKVIDAATQSFSEEYSINSNYYKFYEGNGEFDVYVSRDNSLCGLDLETGTVTTVIDWLKSGFDTTAMDSATILSDGRILCTTYDYETSGGGYSYSGSDMLLTILTKVDPSEIADKQLITVSAWYLDYRVKQRIVEFNKTNELYQIEVTTYSDYDDGTGDYKAGLTKLNNDLISGNIPDIILLNTQMPVDSYISKGILADLNTYIEKDETINREDYLSNVLDALSVGGKLYSISPSFTIQTFVGKTSKVGENSGWTMDEFKAVAAANPDSSMLSEVSKSNFLSNAMSYSLNSYVNRETGECSFNTDGFKAVLEYANTFPDEIDYDKLYEDQNYWQDQQKWYRTDKVLLSNEYFYSFTRIRELEQGVFGEPVTFVGFPCDSKSGSSFYFDGEMAITAKAKNPDGAWEFVRYFLGDEYQNEISGSFPIKESAYASLMEKAKEKPYYMDENNKKVEYDNSYWIGDSEMKIGVNTDEDNEKVMNFIKSVTNVSSYDTDLQNIITEESEAYFKGQKTVDEVAEIIQNRANIYINESR